MPRTLAWRRAGLDHACQSGNMAILLTSLLFVFEISFLPKYRVNFVNNSDLVSSLSQSQSYLSPNFLVILPGLTSSVRLCGVERCPAQQSEEEEEELL